jgi:hypothetical protein
LDSLFYFALFLWAYSECNCTNKAGPDSGGEYFDTETVDDLEYYKHFFLDLFWAKDFFFGFLFGQKKFSGSFCGQKNFPGSFFDQKNFPEFFFGPIK